MASGKEWTIGLVLSFALLATAGAQTKNQITVQFVARGMQPTVTEKIQGDDHEQSLFGHIFMIISIPTLHGPKEEAYGFYSKASVTHLDEHATLSENAQHVKLEIKGPGLTKSEFRCGIKDDCDVKSDDDRKELKRFSESVDSVRIPITEDQRKKIIGEVETWNHKEYELTSQNCVEFVSTVVKDLDYPSPLRILPPTVYLTALKKNIVTEDQRRETERVQIQQHAAEEAAAAQNENNGCENGVFQEANPKFIWNLTFDGDDLTGQRTDGQCNFRLSRTGEAWSGVGTCGKPLKVVMRANDECTQLTSNLRYFCPVLNRK